MSKLTVPAPGSLDKRSTPLYVFVPTCPEEVGKEEEDEEEEDETVEEETHKNPEIEVKEDKNNVIDKKEPSKQV